MALPAPGAVRISWPALTGSDFLFPVPRHGDSGDGEAGAAEQGRGVSQVSADDVGVCAVVPEIDSAVI
jgi:hypothetical protein